MTDPVLFIAAVFAAFVAGYLLALAGGGDDR